MDCVRCRRADEDAPAEERVDRRAFAHEQSSCLIRVVLVALAADRWRFGILVRGLVASRCLAYDTRLCYTGTDTWRVQP